MKVFAGMDPRLALRDVPAYAHRIEAMGFDGLHVPETIHDSLAVSLLALEHTTDLLVRTSVTLAFVRSPTLVAYTAWDLAGFSGGRFELGLGTQVRQNVTERMGMPWSAPAPRLAEYLDVLDALYASFRSGDPPAVAGEHYRVVRLQPYFNPGPDAETPVPATWLGGVNRRVCELAGARAAGFVTHPTNSDPKYLAQRCLPALRAGAAGAGRSQRPELVVGTAVVTGRDDAAVAAERERQRRLFAFLYSTPAYAPTLELHGWEALGEDLRRLVRDERWEDLGSVVDDDVLDALVPSGRHDELGPILLDRYEGLADGLVLGPQPDPADDSSVAELVRALRARAVR